MKLLYKAAASIYCELVILGDFRIAPPSWLFNQPAKLIPHTYSEEIFADKNFTPHERWMIEEAARNMEWFLNGFIRFDIKFDWDPAWEIDRNRRVILRAAATDAPIAYADGYYQAKILGLCSWTVDQGTIIHKANGRT